MLQMMEIAWLLCFAYFARSCFLLLLIRVYASSIFLGSFCVFFFIFCFFSLNFRNFFIQKIAIIIRKKIYGTENNEADFYVLFLHLVLTQKKEYTWLDISSSNIQPLSLSILHSSLHRFPYSRTGHSLQNYQWVLFINQKLLLLHSVLSLYPLH